MGMQPGLPGSQFSGEDSAGREVKDLKRSVRELAAANPLATAGIKAVPDGIVVEGSQTIEGPLVVNGDSQINGSMSINGPLFLQPGSIQNDSLANPILVETSSNYLNNYAVGTTPTVRASLVFIVPDGFTQAVVMSNPTGMAQNSTATTDYLYVQAVVNGVSGGELYTAAPAGLAVGIASPFHTTIYGLTGGQEITVAVATRSGFGTWAASTANQANIYATVMYLR